MDVHGLRLKFKLLCLVYKALYELVIDNISKHIPQKVGNQALLPIANGRINWYNLYCGQCLQYLSKFKSLSPAAGKMLGSSYEAKAELG